MGLLKRTCNGLSLRDFSFLLITSFAMTSAQMNSAVLTLNSYHDKALYGFSLLNITGVTMVNCLERCLANCLCTSFQMCSKTECELCYGFKEERDEAMFSRKGCVTYNFTMSHVDSKTNDGQCSKGCWSVVNCCMISNPCLNGGTCLPASSPHDKGRRFTCQCRDNYGGYRCQECSPGYTGPKCEQPITSCRGYSNGTSISKKYKIFDDNMNLFDVYCNFDKNSSMAWTLIQSYELKLNEDYFKWSFFRDRPVNEESPSWTKYRLSKRRMQSIYEDSSQWRITCDYQVSGTVYTDYVRVSNENANILTFNGISCVEVEYIDIRGHHCSNCTASLRQTHNRDYFSYIVSLHFEPHRRKHSCDFKVDDSLYCGGPGEDSFGHYSCQNEKHRCSASPTATTQMWLGGK